MKNMNLYTVWIPLVLGIVGTIIGVLELLKDDNPKAVYLLTQGNQVIGVPQNQQEQNTIVNNTQQNQATNNEIVNNTQQNQQNTTPIVIQDSEKSQSIVVTPVTVTPAKVETIDWKSPKNFPKIKRDFEKKYGKNKHIKEYERGIRSTNAIYGRLISHLEKFEQSEENLTEQEIFYVSLLKSFAMLQGGKNEIARQEQSKKFNIDNTPKIKDYLQKCIEYDPNGENGKFGEEAKKLLKNF